MATLLIHTPKKTERNQRNPYSPEDLKGRVIKRPALRSSSLLPTDKKRFNKATSIADTWDGGENEWKDTVGSLSPKHYIFWTKPERRGSPLRQDTSGSNAGRQAIGERLTRRGSPSLSAKTVSSLCSRMVMGGQGSQTTASKKPASSSRTQQPTSSRPEPCSNPSCHPTGRRRRRRRRRGRRRTGQRRRR